MSKSGFSPYPIDATFIKIALQIKKKDLQILIIILLDIKFQTRKEFLNKNFYTDLVKIWVSFIFPFSFFLEKGDF